jgi:hypothetical protein
MTHPWMCARECVAHKAQMHAYTAHAAPTRRSTQERNSYTVQSSGGATGQPPPPPMNSGAFNPRSPSCAMPHLVHDPRSISTAPSCGAAETNSGQRLQACMPYMHCTQMHTMHPQGVPCIHERHPRGPPRLTAQGRAAPRATLGVGGLPALVGCRDRGRRDRCRSRPRGCPAESHGHRCCPRRRHPRGGPDATAGGGSFHWPP